MELNEAKLAKRYAISILDIATEQKAISVYREQFSKICSLFSQFPDLKKFTLTPLISDEKKDTILDQILNSLQIKMELKKFLHLIIQNNRIDMLDRILFLFERMAEESLKVSSAYVYSAHKLDKSTLDVLKQYLTKALKKNIEIKNNVKPELIGGLTIRIDNQVIDFSLNSELERVKTILKQEE